jgi:regulator of sigma E protease
MSEIFSNLQVALLGLLGLNIIVFIHELGHFLVARATGIKVEVFSIGMGPKLYKKQFESFELALSALPLGGYCKMQGESLETEEIKPGDMYYGKPWRRLLTVMAGAVFNFIFAYLLFVVVSMMSSNQIILASQIFIPENRREMLAPLASADKVIRINGKAITTFQELETTIMVSAGKTLSFEVLRDEEILIIEKYIPVNESTGVGNLPVLPYLSATIADVVPNSPAQSIGIKAGDMLLSIDGEVIDNFYTIASLRLQERPADTPVSITWLSVSSQTMQSASVILPDGKLGIVAGKPEKVAGLPLHLALVKAGDIFGSTLVNYVHGIGLIFSRQVKMQDALSGPVQTTELIGNIAQSSLQHGPLEIFYILGILSLVIGFMQLLPIPLLDGGLVVLFLLESFRAGRPMPKNFLKIYQIIGFGFLLFLLLLALRSDALYLIRRIFS